MSQKPQGRNREVCEVHLGRETSRDSVTIQVEPIEVGVAGAGDMITVIYPLPFLYDAMTRNTFPPVSNSDYKILSLDFLRCAGPRAEHCTRLISCHPHKNGAE